jgi:uncharacterized membrane protein (UPF0136 family)
MRAMTADQTVLLIYCALLVLGGLMGFIKAGSKASIIASSAFAAILLLFVFGVLPIRYAWFVLFVLVLFFGSRFGKSKKFMPNGMMLILTVITVVLLKYF